MENVGAGDLILPQYEMHTSAYWLTIPSSLFKSLPFYPDQKINGLFGLAYCLHHVSPLFMMCDYRDVGVSIGDNTTGKSLPPHELRIKTSFPNEELFSETDFEPNIFIYDNFPGGIGLSPSLFDLQEKLLERCLKTINDCPCQKGCPSCVGPVKESGELAKEVAREILLRLLAKK